MTRQTTSTIFKKDEVLLLLGAGASISAGIPASREMNQEIEKLLNDPWKEYQSLYFFVKSAILYSDGIHGRFDAPTFNVEKLVETLDDLRKGDEHPLYPFVGAWVPKLYEVAGSDLSKITAFRQAIVRRLRDDWVPLKYREDSVYYSGIGRFQQDLQEPLRVFTLNYDLCVETALADNGSFELERGFNEKKIWDWRRFEHERGEEPPQVYLYKLHGSIDWVRADNDALTYLDAISQIDPQDLAIIFASPSKLQAVDPFLFFAYEFRKWTLEAARIIVAIGYGFADDHINGILRQALKSDPERKLLAVTFIRDKANEKDIAQKKAKDIAGWIGLMKEENGEKIPDPTQIEVVGAGAEEFLKNQLTVEFLGSFFPGQDDLFDELVVSNNMSNPDVESLPKPSMNGNTKDSETEEENKVDRGKRKAANTRQKKGKKRKAKKGG